MSFIDSTKQKTKVRTGSDYVKLVEEHPTIMRVLDNSPEVSWQHFVPQGHNAFKGANAGKGIGFVCPGRGCPVCKWNETQDDEDKLKVRKTYAFNILDLTNVKVCPNEDCGLEYYSKKNKYPAECTCGTSLTKVTSGPRNKIQIMQKGMRIASQLAQIQEEFGEDLSVRDITVETRGKGKEVISICVASQESALNLEEVLGEDWESHKYDIVAIVKPLTIEQVTKILDGESYFEVVGK